MTKSNGSLPERYRRATNIHEGYEVQLRDDSWVQVASTLHITAPLNVVSISLVDGKRLAADPRDQIMSRRLAVAS